MGSCFGPIFGGCHQGPITSTGPASFNPASWAWESGPTRLFFKPNQQVCYMIMKKQGYVLVPIFENRS